MSRAFWIVLFGLMTVGGFASGCASLHRVHRHGHGPWHGAPEGAGPGADRWRCHDHPAAPGDAGPERGAPGR